MMADKLCLLVCESLEREVAAVVESEGFDDVMVHTFPAHCGRPPIGWDALRGAIHACGKDYSQTHLLGGACLAGLQAPPDDLHCRFHKMDGCFSLFVGRDAVESHLRTGGYLLTPGWLARWQQHIGEWGFDQATAREFFAESATRLLLLDTGVDAASAERLAEFAGFVGLPFETVPVGLDFARLFLAKIILEWRLENERGESAKALTAADRRLADHALVFDLIGRLPETTTEAAAIENIFELFTMLCAPASLIYVPLIGGQPGNTLSRPASLTFNEAVQTRLAGLHEDYAWTDSGNGFLLRISRQGETLGVLEIEGLAFPEHKQHYLNLALAIVQVCGLAIANARAHQKSQSLVEKLEQALIQRKQAEEEIASLAKFPDENPNPIARVGGNGNVLYANPSGSLLLQSLDSAVGRPAPARWHDWVTQALASQAGQTIEMEHAGRVYACDVIPIQEGGYVNLYARDITERKRAEDKLRESEARFRDLAELLPQIIYEADRDGNLTYVNRRGFSSFGYTPQDIDSGFNVLQSVIPEDRPRIQAAMPRVLAGEASGGEEFTALRKDGTTFPALIYSAPIIFNGQLRGMRGLIVDITERKQMKAALEESEEIFRLFMEYSPIYVFFKDEKTRPIRLSKNYEKMLGRPVHELLGKTMDELFPSELAKSMVEDDLGILRDGKPIEVIEELNGRTYTTTKFPIMRQGNPSLLAGFTIDITERKRMEQAEREQRILAQALRDTAAALTSTLHFDQVLDRILANVGRVVPHDAASIMLIDAEQRTTRIYRSHGYAERGMSMDMYSWRLKTDDFATLHVMTETGQAVILADTYADPAWVWFPEMDWIRSHIGAPIFSKEQLIGFMNLDSATPGFFTPVHADRLQAFADQAAIAVENARLYDKADRRAYELEQQAIELQTRNEELDAFAHTVAHDLKNPVGLMMGYAETLAQDYSAISDDQRQRFLQTIARNARKMNSIIEELLHLAQVRQVQVATEPLDMSGIVSEALQRLTDAVEQSRAEIVWPDVSAWPVARGYAPWVEEVWINYLSNALKYGGRPPRIELGAEAQPDGVARFWVRDNGPGIPPEAQSRLFTPFTRLDQVRAKGHGLGLSIVRRIVEKLGGQVGVESQVGQGSVFSFTLPSAAGPLS